ncbi:VOC family protein [Flavobacterium agricola]|uniref:VOC family protein n=1 Tax=Flavobacterium agricola TaxID=2870839 RepID=A0ABY6M183_9FLAO|nr:VOC family protein [Flavobacterium agricola]UYW02264.1 VOC family protein [Flavobacterium agricola]
MKIQGTVVCLPIKSIEKTLHFYKHVFELENLKEDEGIIAIELLNLSLFLIEQNAFLSYSKKANRGVLFPENNVANIISCAVETVNDVDLALEKALLNGGSISSKAGIDNQYGFYMGYISDPDGHLWELVCAKPNL